MDEAREAYLFGSVPSGLFRVFTGSARYFFADLLTHMAEDPFGQSGEIATRKRVFAAIEEFIDRAGRATVAEALSGGGTQAAAGQTYSVSGGVNRKNVNSRTEAPPDPTNLGPSEGPTSDKTAKTIQTEKKARLLRHPDRAFSGRAESLRIPKRLVF